MTCSRASLAQKPGKSAAASALRRSNSARVTFAWATNERGGSKTRASCDTDSIVDMRRSPRGCAAERLSRRRQGNASFGSSLTRLRRAAQYGAGPCFDLAQPAPAGAPALAAMVESSPPLRSSPARVPTPRGCLRLRPSGAARRRRRFRASTMSAIEQADLIQSVADALQFISYYHPLDYIE